MKPLAPFPFNTPGVAGLNKQGRNTILGPEWATRATDLVIDDQGRLANRLGYKAQASSKTALAGRSIEKTHVGINTSGVKTLYCADDSGRIYELVSGVWTSRVGYTLPSDGDFQFANFNGKVLAWHADGRMLVQSAIGNNFVNIVASSGTVPTGKAVLAAFGRVWVLTNDKLYYSALLDETAWGATATYFDMRYMWPKGADVATGLAEFNGRLVVFGEENVLFITNTWAVDATATGAVSAAELEDSVQGVGCVERNTIQVVGDDILFLSRLGVQSLGRVIQEKSAPLTDVIPQVRDYVAQEYAASAATVINSAFSTNYGFYVLSFARTCIVVDTRVRLPNGAYRVTEWVPMGAVSTDGYGGLYVTHTDELSKYQGVLDGVTYAGTGGTSVAGDYESGWQDWEAIAPGASVLNKFLKRLKMYVAGGGSGTLTFKWYFDYKEAVNTVIATIPAAPDAAQFGIAQYGIDKYGTSLDITELSKPGTKGGRVIKVGCKINDSTTDFAINQMTLYATTGKQSH